LRQQEKLLKKKKKSRNRFGRFVVTLILVIVFLVLAFYFLNNPSSYEGLKNKITSIFTSGSISQSGSSSQASTGSSAGASNAETTSNAGTGEGNAESTGTNSQGNAQTTDANGNTISASGQDNSGSVSGDTADSSGNVSQGTSRNAGAVQSLWQKIIKFFRQKMSGQADNFPGTISVKIYFAALGQDEVFSFEERLINAGNPQVAVENTVNELLKGPSKSFHYPVIPPGTKLLGVEIYENLAKIDLSQEFLENSLESGILDDYVIYTIVDTVTQVPGVEGVIFLIEGKRIKLYGSVDISIPAIKNEKYLPVETGGTAESS
jgi:spore germination protein GerM